MNKIIIILLLILSASCNKKKEIESIFLTNKNEYWDSKEYCYNGGGNFFQFKKDGNYDRYLLYNNYLGFRLANDDGDLKSGPRTWSIKNDSTFVWDKGVYKIEKISKKEILLSYDHYELKGVKCYVRLSKWVVTPKGPKTFR
jgi:hypothetical protein